LAEDNQWNLMGPYSLADIESYYQKKEYELEDKIENAVETIDNGYARIDKYVAII
jgi:hypothetical protein